jgi:anaerobic magnesium-protoporphyrin IX monomethyl ester cyclase
MAKVLLISYDNDSHVPFFPINLAYIAQSLIKDGHQVACWLQDINHGRAEALTGILDKNHIHMVGLGFVAGYYQYRKAKEISDAVNASVRRNGFVFVLGGHGPAGAPDYFLGRLGADAVVVGDGEKAIKEVFKGERGVVKGEPSTDDSGPFEAYEKLFPLMVYRLIRWPTSARKDFCFPILSSRGCKYHCSFCYRMREGYHLRDVKAIMEEITWLHDFAEINHFQFADELLMASEERTAEICESILRLNFKIKWDCNGRLNYATRPTLELMKTSGCEYINYGIESLNQSILNSMGKGLTVDRIEEGTRATLECGLSPGLNLLWGFPGDTVENLRKEVEFLKKYDPCHELRTIRPVTPYPGTPLYQEAIDKGLLEGAEDFYERKHLNSDLFTVDFMGMGLDAAHHHLFEANRELIEGYMSIREDRLIDDASHLYVASENSNYKSFRGFRAV